MGFARIFLVAVAVLSAVHAGYISQQSPACDDLLSTKLSPGYTVSDAALFSSGSLNSAGIINEFTLCRVRGTVSYDTEDTPILNGPNTLTWELYLPIASGYNDRFIVVGTNSPTLEERLDQLTP